MLSCEGILAPEHPIARDLSEPAARIHPVQAVAETVPADTIRNDHPD